MLYGHGNDLYDYSEKITADFSSNIPYRNASVQIVAHLSGCLHLISDYPDPNARALTHEIAEHHNLSPENVLVTNGSAEAFYLLAHLFAGKHSTITYPAFAEYEDACTLYGHTLSFMPVSELCGSINFTSNETVWFAFPNNPDGSIVSSETIENLCLNNPDSYFIIDNAYGELCTQCQPVIPLHANYPNLISVHSLTKTFAIPGLRLGYIVAEKNIINRLQPLRIPWTVNTLAQEAGSFVMENYSRLLPDAGILCRESQQLQQQLATLSHLEVTPSPCHFFLIRLKSGTASQLKSYLLEKHGILIRDASNFRGLSPCHFRLSVQEKTANDRLTDALRDFFKITA
ncbi:pyridoxal phosphate-dependent aminotransferase [Petrimonas sp.]|jgi:threonine-phosphate decarboxylase|uniref:pyridoxal phosphate-dependent aminotransferase n=1 Tax=Petrimonas TaxID=307628 RepID=UPI000E871754|nr:aminotransferase class I/II-fold pyridoxal phosphate-dependent enzyme [Petrimonas sp.]HBK42604.1 aminotransferase [Porphyromonadaceae bacterium]HMM16545.1 aminotransferase class I/II-fold pyridoxal phosphate-dependent enzyme [Petrimonas sp.]